MYVSTVSTVFEVTLSPIRLSEEFLGQFDYMDIKIKGLDSEYPDDIRRACYRNDGTLYARLVILVGAENAIKILEQLDRGETIHLPGQFTKRQLLDLNAYSRNLRIA